MEDVTGARRRRAGRHQRSSGPSLAPVATFSLLIVLKLYVTRAVVLADPNPWRGLLLEGGFALLLVSAAGLLPKGRLWAWLALDAAVSLLCVALVVYVRQFGLIPTVGTLGTSREVGGVREAAFALVKPVYFLFVADVPLLAVLFATNRARRDAQRGLDRRVLAVLAVAALWVGATFASLAAASPIDDSVAGARTKGLLAYALYDPPTSESVESQEEIERDAASSAASEGAKTVSNPAQPPKKVDIKDPASVQAAFEDLQGGRGAVRVTGAPEPGSAKGRSVILIQAESLSTWVTLARIEGREITPNFNRLAEESWYAPKTITQIGPGNTSDAEFTVNTSLLADGSKPASYVWGDRKIPSLPRLLAEQGYESVTFHTNYVSYWRRNKLYPALGFSKWFARQDFPDEDIMDGIGASDKVLYRVVDKELEARSAKGTKYLAEVITLAAHSPYLGASERSNLDVPSSLRGTTLEDYLRAISYEDDQLGAFIDRLKRDGIWDEAVIVVYGDHFGVRPVGGSAIDLTRREEEAVAGLLGRQPTWGDTYEVPFLIHLPGQKSGARIEKVRGQVDIMPTIADVLGLDLSGTPHVGVSVFDSRARFVAMRYYVPKGTFVTDRYLFRPGVGFNDGKVSPLDEPGTGTLPLSTVPRSRYKRIKTLAALNRLYVQSLPKR